MTEFTPEWIAGAREVVGNDDASPSGQIAFIVLDHIECLQARVAELEEQQRWIPANEFIAKEGGVYYFENLRGELRIGYFQPKNMLYAQLEHYAKRVFTMPLPKPPESEEE